ncbi:phospholipase A2-like [Chelonus insularis]|uniref:phospholipase A2-like n=1 Tax=Chelonus insularis TaxID=460826 RepID=UPI00158A5740|nr:phospholipase A2-like [Chelonus insularis]
MIFHQKIVFLVLSTTFIFLLNSHTSMLDHKKLSNDSVEVLYLDNVSINDFEVLKNKDYNNTVVKNKRSLVFPGTLWCGIQNVAVYDEDLGFFSLTDACCREHQRCSFEDDRSSGNGPTPRNSVPSVLAGERYKGEAICRCEKRFYRCLRRTNTIISRNLGRLYFNIIQRTCFTYDHPSLYCVKYQGFFRLRCLEYVVNTSAPMVIEERDNPFFF